MAAASSGVAEQHRVLTPKLWAGVLGRNSSLMGPATFSPTHSARRVRGHDRSPFDVRRAVFKRTTNEPQSARTENDERMSIVYLIGAGPGDPGLITVRGLQYLSEADVVLYDHPVPARLLRSARPDAEQIDVGTAAPQPLEQEAICYLLAEKAREGKVVARLKWGDPFVFDSGGSEALFLHEQGVRFEVVPGLPAGIAVPGYAGIPITYPGGGDTVTFIRGHEDDGKTRTSIDWDSLAHLDGTLVCYAGPEQLPEMLNALLAHGRPPEDSAAVVYGGTRPTQQTIAGTLLQVAA